MPQTDPARVTYTYHLVDARAGSEWGTLPFLDVSFSTAVGAAGAFKGRIPLADEQVRAKNPWALTEPRRTMVYVVRHAIVEADGLTQVHHSVEWCGIIWDRDRDDGSGNMQVVAATPESYWKQRRIRFDVQYFDIEQTEIFCDLVTRLTIVPGGDIRTECAPITTGRLRDREYLSSQDKNALEALQELSEVNDGFEWTVQPFQDPVTAGFRHRIVFGYPRLGRTIASGDAPRLQYLRAGGGTLLEPVKVVERGASVPNTILAAGAKLDDGSTVRAVASASDLGRQEVEWGFPLLEDTYSNPDESNADRLWEQGAAQLRAGWAGEIVLGRLRFRGDMYPSTTDVAAGDDVVIYTDGYAFPTPTTVTGRAWVKTVKPPQGDAGEEVELTVTDTRIVR